MSDQEKPKKPIAKKNKISPTEDSTVEEQPLIPPKVAPKPKAKATPVPKAKRVLSDKQKENLKKGQERLAEKRQKKKEESS